MITSMNITNIKPPPRYYKITGNFKCMCFQFDSCENATIFVF